MSACELHYHRTSGYSGDHWRVTATEYGYTAEGVSSNKWLAGRRAKRTLRLGLKVRTRTNSITSVAAAEKPMTARAVTEAMRVFMDEAYKSPHPPAWFAGHEKQIDRHEAQLREHGAAIAALKRTKRDKGPK